MRWIIIVIVVCLSAQPCLGVVINVPVDQPTIQAGIDAASDGDTVLVAPDTYTENINLNGKSILLVSIAGRDATFIEAFDPDVDIVTITGGEDTNCVIDGFTIRNTSHAYGVFCQQSSPTIQNCDISHCTHAYFLNDDGAGIRCEASGARIMNCLIHDNFSNNSGGGLLIVGGSAVLVKDNAFYNNTAGHGAAIACFSEINDCLIERNLVFDNVIEFNGNNGAVYFNGLDDPNIRFVNNTVVGNTRGVTVLLGVGIDIRNNIIVSNTLNGLVAVNTTYDYNNVWNNGYSNEGGPNGISADPMFRDETDNVFYLHGHSPCIDAGDPDSAYSDPDGTRSDIGAIPFQACGDADGSGGFDIDDVVFLIAYIFSSGPPPVPIESGDADCSGGVDIDDVVYLIAYIFSGGYTPCDIDGDEVPDC